ncbi:MAG: hypothetical protein EON93_20960 [Burkholderiales bacterium]|nr:MAG: hypothetical protein EON93_20960 [Burkholderiales bacterium]
MFGPKISKVFRSRWHALFWAGSVMLTAYCTVPSANDHGDGKEAAAIVAALHHGSKPAHHVNPWAKNAE